MMWSEISKPSNCPARACTPASASGSAGISGAHHPTTSPVRGSIWGVTPGPDRGAHRPGGLSGDFFAKQDHPCSLGPQPCPSVGGRCWRLTPSVPGFELLHINKPACLPCESLQCRLQLYRHSGAENNDHLVPCALWVCRGLSFQVTSCSQDFEASPLPSVSLLIVLSHRPP